MSKKHFEAIAAILSDSLTVEEVARRMATFCKDQNERFDRNRFLEAAGVK